MSEGDWRKHFTLGLAGTLASVWIGGAVLTALPVFEYDPAQYETQEERAEARADYDTKSQVWMAWAAWAQVTVGALGLFGLGITIYFARNAWLESRAAAIAAQEQASIAREELLNRSRPRLFVSLLNDYLWGADLSGQQPGLEYTFTNVGEHTAHILTGWFEYRVNAEHPTPGGQRTKGKSTPRIDEEYALMPGREVRVDVRARYVFDENELAILALHDRAPDHPVVKAMGFIHYRDHLGAKRVYEFCFVCLPPSDVIGGKPWAWLLYTDDRPHKASDDQASSVLPRRTRPPEA